MVKLTQARAFNGFFDFTRVESIIVKKVDLAAVDKAVSYSVTLTMQSGNQTVWGDYGNEAEAARVQHILLDAVKEAHQ